MPPVFFSALVGFRITPIFWTTSHNLKSKTNFPASPQGFPSSIFSMNTTASFNFPPLTATLIRARFPSFASGCVVQNSTFLPFVKSSMMGAIGVPLILTVPVMLPEPALPSLYLAFFAKVVEANAKEKATTITLNTIFLISFLPPSFRNSKNIHFTQLK